MSLSGLACEESADRPLEFEADIRWTESGVPHITAPDLRGVAFGQGYATTKLNGCLLADQFLRARSERAAHFGPGRDGEHLDSDFVVLHRRLRERAATALAAAPPEVLSLVEGYTAGYNHFIETRRDELACAEASWLSSIEPVDLMTYYVDLVGLATTRELEDYIVAAIPPGQPGGEESRPTRSLAEVTLGVGSNGWALGPERSEANGGMVLANPHFPWEGELKLFENHLTIPGELDVYGASLLGVTGVLIGFNENVAWTHTVSFGQRFTFYKLELDPGDPTVYMHDGVLRPMEANTYTVDVLGEDGVLTTATRTMYRSHYGPIVAPTADGFPWTRDYALTVRDANAENDRMVEQFLGMDRAGSLDELIEVHRTVQGIPWVNTVAAGRDGGTWYADSAPTPNLSDATLARWDEALDTDIVTGLFYDLARIVVLDGSTSEDDWVASASTLSEGVTPFEDAPSLGRPDFVFNANNQPWATHPDEPIVGTSPLYGPVFDAPSPRARMNATMLTEISADGASGADGRFSLEELRDATQSNRGMIAELILPEVLQRCRRQPTVSVQQGLGGAPVDVELGQACEALEGWDGRTDLDSRGALLWREFCGSFDFNTTLKQAGSLFSVPFDEENWVGTPNTLVEYDDVRDNVLIALGQAVLNLEQAGIPLDARLGDYQFTKRYVDRIGVEPNASAPAFEEFEVSGGHHYEGSINIVEYDVFRRALGPSMPREDVVTSWTSLTTEGYVINTGTSFMMATAFEADGPRAFALSTYSQSDDPLSEFYNDQMQGYQAKRWREVRFTEDQILADPALERERVEIEAAVP